MQRGSDFFFERREEPAEAAQTIAELCMRRIPSFLRVDPVKEIQVLAPAKKGRVRRVGAQRAVAGALQPATPRPARAQGGRDDAAQSGTRSCQTRNNYQLEWKLEGAFGWESGQGAFNGDMGFISHIDPQTRAVTVVF